MKQISPGIAAAIGAVILILIAVWGWKTITHTGGPGSSANPYEAKGAPAKGGPPAGMGSGGQNHVMGSGAMMSGSGGSGGMMSGPGASGGMMSGPPGPGGMSSGPR